MTQFLPGTRRAIVLGLAAVLLASCGGGDDDHTSAPSAPDVAVLADGSVKAVDRLGMRTYFAIPFAAPPLGAQRWMPPTAPAKWTTTLANTSSAAPCLQTSASPFRLSGDSEDCLYLDVHAPTGPGPFPVMVWIHGGAFNTGGAVTYADPSPLVSKGVIVVTVAYRMGAMGFLGHPVLEAADASVGNYGIMDQQAALKWVQGNIAAFGGDPANVTLFGESAGGFSVMTHLASPLSKGLFQKAIIESGAYGVNGQLTKAQLEANSTAVVTNAIAAAGVSNCAPVTADCLRALPDAVVRNQLAAAFNASMSSPTPSVDGKVLPKSIKATFVAGENNKVPVVNGSNENEYTLFIAITELAKRAAATPPNFDPANTSFALSAAAYPATAAALGSLGGHAADAASLYPLATFGSNTALQPSLAASSLGTDVIFACNGLNVSKRAAQQGTPIWMYEFRDQTAPPSIGVDANGNYGLSFPQGAAHSYEIQYVFNFGTVQTQERKDLQTTMSQYWTNFAKAGDPNGGTLPTWAGFGSGAVMGLDVASDGGVAARTAAQFSTQHQCDSTWSGLTF